MKQKEWHEERFSGQNLEISSKANIYGRGEIITGDVAGVSSSECGLGTGSNISLKKPRNEFNR